MRLLLRQVILLFFVYQSVTSSADERLLQDFITNMEELVMSTTDRALNVTKNVYTHCGDGVVVVQSQNREDCQLMQNYISAVNQALQHHSNYTEKQKLFTLFRDTNRIIETHKEMTNPQPSMAPSSSTNQYLLISADFYNAGHNTTEFDNLYLDFMQKFAQASEALWRNMGEELVEQHEELLEIIDEIANEKELKEKDKLYDEFIEMYLFKK